MAQTIVAQPYTVNVTIIIPPPYSPYLQDYLQYENRMVLQLQNLTSQSQSVKLIGSVEGDNGIALVTNENYQPATPINIPPNGIYRIPGSTRSRGFLDPDNLEFVGPENLKIKILKDGILPEGTYTICIRAVDYVTGEPLSDEAPSGCTIVPLSFPTPPQTVLPECESDIETRLPAFQWTLPGGNTGQAALQYDLYIVEWLEGANPQDLVQLAVDYNAGNAIVRRNLLAPMYQYLVTDPRLKENTPYLWVVKVRDRMGKVTFENDGLSEICSFTNRQTVTESYVIPNNPFDHGDFEIQQFRTHISGKLNYKFPGDNLVNMGNLLNRSISIPTEEVEFQVGNNMQGELEIVNDNVLALADHNYIDGFPVSTMGSKALANMPVRLVEGWVITDCNVTYYPNGGPTVHKDFIILPDDWSTPGAFDGGTNIGVYIDGLTNREDGNALWLDTISIWHHSYSRTLKVDHTDGDGRFQFSFTQSSPGLMLNNYPGSATIYQHCEPVEVPVEENPFVHIYDEVSNPAEIYNMQPNFGEEQSQPPGHFGAPGNLVNRLGYPDNNYNQKGYDSIVITGGHLVKVLRLEVVTPFFYSPNLIFWTQPGDTMTLPDQVSYVKSIDLDLFVAGGMFENRRDFQFYDAGLPIPHVDVLASRKLTGLPAAIPIEEGQGLRTHTVNPPGHDNNNYSQYGHAIEMEGYVMSDQFDSVSILRSNGYGMLPYKRLVAGHPYYFEGSTPESGALHYDIALQSKQYEVFITPYCMMNLETNLNSFSNHKAVHIRDTIIAYPQPPKVFGRVVTSTNVDIGPLKKARVRLIRYASDDEDVRDVLVTETDAHGLFHFDPIPISQNSNTDYRWRLEVSKSGYDTILFPDTTYKTRPGVQWSTGDIHLNPLGNLLGYVKDEDGKLIPAIVRLANGPFIETTVTSAPAYASISCGDDNQFGDALDASTRSMEFVNMENDMEVVSTNASQFKLPAQSGNNLSLIVIPLPEQYFQETCHVNVQEVPYGEYQQLGYIVVKEKLHRLSFAIKDAAGNAAQAKVYVGDHMRETNDLGFVAFRFASPAEEYRVRIVPDLPTLVPVDTVMEFPVSKTYKSHNFILKEGRKLRILVVRDQTGQEFQSENPTPIAGVTVQTLLSSSESGNAYIQCITNADGICTLEGVPTSSPTVDVSVWKDDDDILYIGKTVAVSTTRPLNPPFTIKMKVLANVVVPDIWGFPTAITDMEIKEGNNGKLDTLLGGIITTIPDNIRFKTEQDVVQLPYPKIKFAYSGERDENGRRIMQPATNTGVTLFQHELRAVLYDKFDVTMTPKRSQNGASNNYLSLQKIDNNKGKMSGVVETELSSFNYSYTYDGKFYLGKTPTEYNIEVFQSGIPPYQHMNMPVGQVQGQEPEPGPNDFYLMDIGPQNKPRSQAFTVFQFPATSDSSRSFVSEEAFYIHAILHTDIDHVTPRDLKLNIGKIVVTNESLETFSNGSRMLDFRLGKNWRYYSTTPFQYNFEFGSITAATGFVNTGQIDVPVELIKIKPDKLYITQLDNIDHLTLAGIKDLPIHEEAKIIFSKGNMDIGWKLTVHRRDSSGNYDHDAVVATLAGLPEPFMADDYINIKAIELNSQNDDMHVNLDGNVRPFDICDFTVQSITTGNGYFILNGSSYLGRDGVRVPNLASSFMGIQFNGPKDNITGKIVSSYQGSFETKGSVSCTLDPNTASAHKQHFKNKKFYSTTRIRVYEQGKGEFFLNGILEVDFNYVKLHIIDKDLDIPDVQYTDADQAIHFESGKGRMMVRSGVQPVTQATWDDLVFTANMFDFKGVNNNQPPMTFTVTGAVSATNSNLEVENIEIAGGLAEIELSYIFESQSLFGSLDFTPTVRINMGPVSVSHILAQILAGKSGFIFGGLVEGDIAEVFPARLGILLGSHTSIPNGMIQDVMGFSRFHTPPPEIADLSLSGFFITAQVHLVHAPMDTFDFGVGYIAGGAEVGFDARVFMDFDAQGFAFGFDALAYAEVLAAADSWLSPCGICLAASLQLMLSGSIREVGNSWDVAGTGCGSLLFTIAICGVPVDDIGGKCNIRFSSLNGTDVSAAFGESCSNDPTGGFDCTPEEE